MKTLVALVLLAGCTRAQHEVTAPGELLTSDGRLREPGWARSQLQHWDPTRVADPSGLRQWDFFTIMNAEAAVNLALTDLGFIATATVGVVDFPTNHTERGALSISSGADAFSLSSALVGTGQFTPARATTPAMQLSSTDDGASLTVAMPAALGDAADGAFTLSRRATQPFLSLATPFSDPHQFFYEQKLPNLTATGAITIGAKTWSFGDGSIAIMDWGRGQWPSTATWRWAGGAGDDLAFNLGEGFGDSTAGTENLLVVGDQAHKLGVVSWTHDATNPMADWTFHDSGTALTLHPVAQEIGGIDLGEHFQHLQKAYGRFQGTISVDGITIPVDDVLGFAEEVSLAW